MREFIDQIIEEAKKLSMTEIENLIVDLQRVISELQNLKNSRRKTYTFKVEATVDPRKHGKPYVAKLVLQDGKIQREFYNIPILYGKKEVTMSGEYTASEGDLIEIREGGSWKNDYRYVYIVQEGKLVKVANSTDSRQMAKVLQYLKGEISVDELIN